MPEFSIITPTFNRSSLIKRMISSVLNQTFKNWELIILDDGSTDNTSEIVAEFADTRIHYYYFSERQGAAAKRNKGVSLSKADNIIFLDSDDEVEKEWLESFNNVNNSRYKLLSCGYKRIDRNNNVTVEMPRDLGGLFDNLSLNYLSGTLVIKKKLFYEVKGFDESLISGIYTDFLIRLAPYIKERKYRIKLIEKTLLKIYEHRGLRIRNNPYAVYKGTIQLLKKHKHVFKLNSGDHFDYLSVAGVNSIRLGNHREGTRLFIKAFKVKPGKLKGVARLLISIIPFLRSKLWNK